MKYAVFSAILLLGSLTVDAWFGRPKPEPPHHWHICLKRFYWCLRLTCEYTYVTPNCLATCIRNWRSCRRNYRLDSSIGGLGSMGEGYPNANPYNPTSGGGYSVAEPYDHTSGGGYSIAEPYNPTSGGGYSIAEPYNPTSGGGYSVAEPYNPTSGGGYSVAEPYSSHISVGGYSVPEPNHHHRR